MSKVELNYVQCTQCGEVYKIERKLKSDVLYIDSFCPCCDGERALNVGRDLDDIYLYYDVTLDKRYF